MEKIFWKDGWEGKAKGGIYFRAFDLIKFVEKIEHINSEVVGIKLDGNNIELIINEEKKSPQQTT